MKCRTCGSKAVVNMKQHKLALCQMHFLEWIPNQTERFIKKYEMFTHFDRILVAVSGGKDSLSLWDILTRLGYHADGVYIDLGIGGEGGYSERSKQLCLDFSQKNDLTLHVVDVKQEYGESVIQLIQHSSRGQKKPCSVCGLTKRHIMNMASNKNGYDALVTGHNLDDEVAVLFANTLYWEGDFLIRQAPVLPAANGFARKVKPLCRFSEKEMAAYAVLRGIDYIYEECPFAIGSSTIYYKQTLNQLEHDNPGEKLRFYLHFLKAKKNGLFAQERIGKQELHDCIQCGLPTSIEGKCSFCRMLDRQDYSNKNQESTIKRTI